METLRTQQQLLEVLNATCWQEMEQQSARSPWARRVLGYGLEPRILSFTAQIEQAEPYYVTGTIQVQYELEGEEKSLELTIGTDRDGGPVYRLAHPTERAEPNTVLGLIQFLFAYIVHISSEFWGELHTFWPEVTPPRLQRMTTPQVMPSCPCSRKR